MSWSGAILRQNSGDGNVVRKVYESLDKRDREQQAYVIMAGSGFTPLLLGGGKDNEGRYYNDISFVKNAGQTLNFLENTMHCHDAGRVLGAVAQYSRGYLSENTVPSCALFQKSYHWHDYLNVKLKVWEGNIARMPVDFPHFQIMASVQRCKDVVSTMVTDDVALIHGDYTQQNIVWDSEKEHWKVLDFGAALIGDPRFDLGKIIWVNGHIHDRAAVNMFVDAWRSVSGLEVCFEQVMFYATLHAIAAMDWTFRQSLQRAATVNCRTDFLQRALCVLQSDGCV